MKTAISFIFSFILMCVVGTVFAGLLFMAGIDLKYLVAGQPLSLFSLEFFLRGVFFTFPLICVIAQLLLILYIIRHPAEHLIPFLMFVIIALVSWLILIPCDMQLADTYSKKAHVEDKYVQLSTGYFREEVGGVYYYTRILPDGTADGVFLDVNGSSARKSGIFPFYGTSVTNAAAQPYADVLVKKAVQPSEVIAYPMEVYSSLIENALSSWQAGFGAWFTFATLGLALLAVYGLQFFSSWRLLNSFLIVLAGLSIAFLNYLVYSEKFFPDFVGGLSEHISFLSSTNPFIVLLNFVIFILFAAFGIVMGIYRHKKRLANLSDDEE